MRVVLDTNILVSGVISAGGSPRILLDGARGRVFELCTRTTLLAELLDVISREKFAARLFKAGLTPQGIVADIRRVAYMANPSSVPRVIKNDPDDDHVLACAVTGQAALIVSGDKHLQDVGAMYQGIRIVRAAEAINLITRLPQD